MKTRTCVQCTGCPVFLADPIEADHGTIDELNTSLSNGGISRINHFAIFVNGNKIIFNPNNIVAIWMEKME